MQNNIVFLDALSLGENNLRESLQSIGNYTEYPTTSPNETLNRCKGANIVLTNKVVLNKEILTALKDTLKLVCITATGTNNVDLQTAKDLGIEVKNVAGYSTKSVAQHTLMMALALSAKLPFYDSYCKSGTYAKSPIFTNVSTPLELLDNKKWRIIGLGTIGLEVARLAGAFGAKISYYSTSGKNQNPNYPCIALESLLKESDVISIHAPLTPSTENTFDAEAFAKMKDGVILINTARGGLIVEEALADALHSGKVYGAGLDVLRDEPPKKDNPLFHLNNTSITAHIAWLTRASRLRAIDIAIENFKAYLNGTPTSVIN